MKHIKLYQYWYSESESMICSSSVMQSTKSPWRRVKKNASQKPWDTPVHLSQSLRSLTVLPSLRVLAPQFQLLLTSASTLPSRSPFSTSAKSPSFCPSSFGTPGESRSAGASVAASATARKTPSSSVRESCFPILRKSSLEYLFLKKHSKPRLPNQTLITLWLPPTQKSSYLIELLHWS